MRMWATSALISSAENCFSKDAISVPFLPSRIDFSIWASGVAFCHSWSLKLRTPSLAKDSFGCPSGPWQSAQVFPKILAAAGSAAGTAGAKARAVRSVMAIERRAGMGLILRNQDRFWARTSPRAKTAAQDALFCLMSQHSFTFAGLPELSRPVKIEQTFE